MKSNKNYTFNNCTITINEEGKAIDVLREEAQARREKQTSVFSLMTSLLPLVTSAMVIGATKSKASEPRPNPSTAKRRKTASKTPAKKRKPSSKKS